MLFLCAIVLWGFVFAWHTQYTNRPVFVFKLEPGPFIAVTLVGIIAAVVFYLFLDPSLRPKIPEEYPADLKQWFASVLFSLFFSQLFLLFAPFAWLMRLFQNRWVATSLTVLFGVCVLAHQNPVAPNADSAAAAGGAPGRQNRHGISRRLVLSARRRDVDLVVDLSV